MRRLLRAVRIYFGSPFTWPTAWRQAKPIGPYHVESRAGELWIRPTAKARPEIQITSAGATDEFTARRLLKAIDASRNSSRILVQ